MAIALLHRCLPDFSAALHLAPPLARRKGLRPFPYGAPGCGAGRCRFAIEAGQAGERSPR